MRPVYVIGHKNPDVDSIAAAIGYQLFKQNTADGLFVAAAAGELNEESRFLLDYLGLEYPVIIKDVGTTVEDLLEDKEPHSINADTTLQELGAVMRSQAVKTMPVLDEQQRFLGLITIGDVAMAFMESLGSGQEIEKSPAIIRELLNRKASHIMKTKDLVLFENDEKLEEAQRLMLATRYRNYPVVDQENRFLGMISRYNLLQRKRRQIILVDHNEKSQAVDGVEEAEILEVIDHHRVGDLQTILPIYFHNEPVGSTSTLVAEKLVQNHITVDRSIAALLLAGIITDTMMFKSPTTTAKDRLLAEKMEQIAGLESIAWGKKLYLETNRVGELSDLQVITGDLKEYASDSLTFAISQVEIIDLALFSKRRASLLHTMEDLCKQNGYALMCLMVTDIFEGGTEMITAGAKSYLVEDAFLHEHVNGGIFLKGILSRKKQVVPVIYEALRKENTI